MKKTIILITFLVASFFAGNAFAACSIYDTSDCPPIPTSQQQVYTPVLPQIYESNAGFIESTPVYYSPNEPTTSTSNPENKPTSPVLAYVPQPTYTPTSPIIFNGDGTYTEQNNGKIIGTKTKIENNSTNTSSEKTTDGLLSGIFGNTKNKIFSSGTTTEVDANMKALVNSKGLAMGTNNTSCQNGQQYLILYKNITNQALTNVAIRISLPNGIIPTNTVGGSYSERDNTVTLFIGSLSKNQEGQILINTKTTGTISGVARTELVYTYPNQTQDMIISYAFENETCKNGSALGASVGGSNFFSGTLLGWLFLALFVSAFLYLIRFFLKRKEDSHGHAPAHAH